MPKITEDKLFYQKKLSITNKNDIEDTINVCTALNNKIRIDMLTRIMQKPYKLPELKKIYNISNSSILFHVDILERAKLIHVVYEPSKKGKVQVCYKGDISNIHIDLGREQKYKQKKISSFEIPIGQFTDIYGDTRAHFLTNECLFESSPFLSSRFESKIILVYKSGYITYAIPNHLIKNKKINSLEISFEICSEAPDYMNNWKSDLIFYINDIKLCDYTCTGDFGDRIGHITVEPLPLGTQYGQMVTLKITDQGILLNEILVNKDIKLKNLNLSDGNKFSFKIECPKTGNHIGGFNLFSKSYGDYQQDIRITIVY